MGYRSPSADEVYRYVFRLEGPGRGLSDRFSWSILVVNDSSPVCREFLARYCIDLCIRTADRIRFVFFSNVPDRELQGVVERQGLRPSRARLGVLGYVLQTLASPFRPAEWLDFEDEHWRDLRPPALLPFTEVADIEARLSWETTQNTAIPGSLQALQFAQRLGIGRHVPCILVFTDIGALNVHVLPFAGQSADEIHHRIRYWIDSFYELNRDALERWRVVENEIESLARDARSSVRAINAWRERRLGAWRDLRRIAELTRTLSADPEQGLRDLTSMSSDYAVPSELRSTLWDFARRFATFASQEQAAATLAGLADELSARAEPEAIGKFIRKVAKSSREGIGTATRALLTEAESASQSPPPERSPREGVFKWWRKTAMSLISKADFVHQRKAWESHVPREKFRELATNDRLRTEYAAFREAVGKAPIAGDPTLAADRTLAELAAYYGIPAGSDAWAAATARHRDHLVENLAELRATAPPWLVQPPPELTIGECVPPGGNSDRASFVAFVASSPRLQELLQRVEEVRNEEHTSAAKLHRSLHLWYRDRICDELRREARQWSMVSNDRASALEALRAFFAATRADLEAQVTDDAAETATFADLSAVPRLTAALDEYDWAVDRIEYPHLRDPALIPVNTRMELPEAAEVAYRRPEQTPEELLKATLIDAVAADRKAHADWPRAREEARQWKPSAAFTDALRHALTPGRLAEVVDEAPSESLDPAFVAAVLDVLIPAELGLLWTRLHQSADGPPQAPADLRAGILTGLGLAPDHPTARPPDAAAAQELKAKIESSRFDVFMVHNSADKALVLEVSRHLRLRGVYPWIDVEQIPPGRWFQDVIQPVIRVVRTAAVFLGRDGIGRWQALEVRTFLEQCVSAAMPVIPVLLPGVAQVPESLVFLRGLHHVRFHRTVHEEAALDQLAWGITGVKPR